MDRNPSNLAKYGIMMNNSKKLLDYAGVASRRSVMDNAYGLETSPEKSMGLANKTPDRQRSNAKLRALRAGKLGIPISP